MDLSEPIRPRPTGCVVPLADIQLEYFRALYNEVNGRVLPTLRLRAGAVRIMGPLNVPVLRHSIEMVIRRHESLRTRILVKDGIPRQHIEEDYEHSLGTVQLTADSPVHMEEQAKSSAQEFFNKRIDLTQESLFDGLLLQLSSTDHVLLLALEHLAGDAVSCAILNSEIWTVYNQITQGQPPSLPRLPVQFGDYAVWQEQMRDARRAKDQAYWCERMTGAPVIRIPHDHDLNADECSADRTIHLPFGKGLSIGLRELAQRERTLLPIAVLTAYAAAICHWLDISDLALRFISHRRQHRVELHNMIGWLASPLYFRVDAPEDRSLTDLLRRVHLEFISAADHQDYVPPIPPECAVEIMFNWGGMVAYSARWSANQFRSEIPQLSIQPFQLREDKQRKFYASFSDTPSGVVATLSYRPSSIASESMDRLGYNIRLAAATLAQQPGACIGSIPFRTQ